MPAVSIPKDRILKNIAKNLQMFRTLNQLSVRKLSIKANVPIGTLFRLLYKSYKEIGITTLYKLAEALDVSVDELIK